MHAHAVLDVRPLCRMSPTSSTDAQVWFVLRQLAAPVGPHVVLLPPSVGSLLLKLPALPAFLGCAFQDHSDLLLLFNSNFHWTCLHLQVHESGAVLSTCFDGRPGTNSGAAHHLTCLLAKMLGRCVMQVQERCIFEQQDADSCGAILGHHVLALCEASRVVELGPAAEEGFGGLSAEEMAQLGSILREHGVPQDQCEARVQARAKKLGTPALKQALNAKHPWQAMKAAGSQRGCMFKWVKPEELTAQIEARAAAVAAEAKEGRQNKGQQVGGVAASGRATCADCTGQFCLRQQRPAQSALV